MTRDLSRISEELVRLVQEQLIMRVVLCGRPEFSGCRIELLSAVKQLDCNKDVCAFVHTKSEFYLERQKLVDTFEFNPEYFQTGLANPFDNSMRKVVGYWHRNITPNSETPQSEWLQSKPFVGVLTARNGPMRLSVEKGARPLLGYYGLLYSQLSVNAKRAVEMKGWNKDLEQTAELAIHVEQRFRALFMQTQHDQFTRALDAY